MFMFVCAHAETKSSLFDVLIRTIQNINKIRYLLAIKPIVINTRENTESWYKNTKTHIYV